MIGYKRTKQEIKGDRAKEIKKQLEATDNKKTGGKVRMPDKFSISWK